MNYLSDPCGDRAVPDVPPPVQLRGEPIPDSVVYPKGIAAVSKSWEWLTEDREEEGRLRGVGT